jgi:molecular chaperone GrpE
MVMGKAVSIPVKVIRGAEPQVRATGHDADVREVDSGQVEGVERVPSLQAAEEPAPRDRAQEAELLPQRGLDQEADTDQWRNRALRLQAEMDNYRKRQQRLAQGQVEEERIRLLGTLLSVVDDIERALVVEPEGMGSEDGLRRGVELTHRAALQILGKEGVERIEADGRPFDPRWHEAVSILPRNGSGVDPDTVIQVLAPGYRLGERLLRPARVVVAV